MRRHEREQHSLDELITHVDALLNHRVDVQVRVEQAGSAMGGFTAVVSRVHGAGFAIKAKAYCKANKLKLTCSSPSSSSCTGATQGSRGTPEPAPPTFGSRGERR